MSKEILLVVEAVCNEKGVEKGIIFEAIEAALASATRKKTRRDIDVRVAIDRNTGDYESFRRWLVVADEDELEAEDQQIHLTDALARDSGVEVGGWIEEPMDSIEFGRIAAQAAKQVIVQKVREAERAKLVDAYQDRVGELVTGTIKRIDRGSVILDLGNNAEALVTKDQLIPKESVRPGDRMRGVLTQVRSEVRGPQLFVSRTVPELLIELFKLEVPEVGEGLIEILGAARDPGQRAKIAVRPLDSRIDPVGACVGMRGSRVQAVSNELNGEKVDIIPANSNPAQFVINAMAPAEVLSIVIDEDRHSMDVAVREEDLPQAIGRGGQNVRLATQLTGWELNVMSEEQAEEKSQSEAQALVDLFCSQLAVDEDLAIMLVEAGFSSVDEVAYIPIEEMLTVEGFDEALVNELRDRAKDVLLTRAIASEEFIGSGEPSEALLGLKGINMQLAYTLAANGITTPDELAECAIDDIIELEGMDEELAGQLIMTAREPWFANQ